MKAFSATLLYEDQLGPTRRYGLHLFVMACVFDIVNGLRHRVEKCVESRPLKGNGNLLRSTRQDVGKIAADGRKVLSVFDNDRVRALLKLPADASDQVVELQIRSGYTGGEGSLDIFLLKENTESVLKAAATCTEIDHELLASAVEHKNLLARDILFKRLATETHREARDCVLLSVPSIAALVTALSKLVHDDMI